MIGILSEVGSKVSARWVTATLLPGLLVVAAGITAVTLRHSRALDFAHLVLTAERLGAELAARPARLSIVVAAVLIGAGLIGTAAAGLGQLIQRWWLRERFLTGIGKAISRSRISRRSRALAAARRAGAVPVTAYLPQRPTWMGDRVRLIEARVAAQYHVSATLVWPRLWLLLGEDARGPITGTHARFVEAVTLAGWGCLYLLAGLLWWPSLVVGAGVCLTGWWRSRAALGQLADLVEAAIDIHLRTLAAALNVSLSPAAVTEAEGRMLNDLLRKAGG